MSWQELREQGNLLLTLAERQQRVQERLTRYREEMAPPGRKRMTQEDAAERAKVPVRNWQRWEGGKATPHLSNLRHLAENLRIPLEDFVEPAPAPDGTTASEMLQELRENQRAAFSMLEAIATQLDAISEQVESIHEQSEPKSEGPRRAAGRRPRRAA